MKILESSDDYIKEFNEIIDENPSWIYISTFGMYLGISVDENGKVNDWQSKYPKPIRTAIDKIIEKSIPCKIITGEVGRELCVKDCPHCIKANEKLYQRLLAHIDIFHKDNLSLMVKVDYHQKMIVSDKRYIIGGRNLSESSYADLSFSGTDQETIKSLKEIFERQFNEE